MGISRGINWVAGLHNQRITTNEYARLNGYPICSNSLAAYKKTDLTTGIDLQVLIDRLRNVIMPLIEHNSQDVPSHPLYLFPHISG